MTTHDTPETALAAAIEERAAFKRAELHRGHWCAECVAETVAAERARIAEAVRPWIESIGFTNLDTGRRITKADARSAVLAIIEKP